MAKADFDLLPRPLKSFEESIDPNVLKDTLLLMVLTPLKRVSNHDGQILLTSHSQLNVVMAVLEIAGGLDYLHIFLLMKEF